jgi:hypothetical protein
MWVFGPHQLAEKSTEIRMKILGEQNVLITAMKRMKPP